MSHAQDLPVDPSPHSLECEDMRSALSDRIDGRLESDLAPFLEEHLQQCPSCRAESSAMEVIVGVLRDQVPPEVGEGFDAGVALRVAQHRRSSRIGGRIAIAAMVLAAFGLGTILGQLLSRDEPGGGDVAVTEKDESGSQDGVLPVDETPDPLLDRPDELAGGGAGSTPGVDEARGGAEDAEVPPVDRGDDPDSQLAATDDGEITDMTAAPGDNQAGHDDLARADGTVPPDEERDDATAQFADPRGSRQPTQEGPGEEGELDESSTVVADAASSEGRRLMREAEGAIVAGRHVEAERRLRQAVMTLDGVDDQLHVQALLQHSRALDRLGQGRQAISACAEALAVADRGAELADETGALEALATRACDELFAYLELPANEPVAGDVEPLRDSQLCAHVQRLEMRLEGRIWVEGDSRRAVGRIEISRAGLAEIATDALAGEIRDFMKRYPDRYRVGIRGR